jgi:hypothetical protein
MNTLNVEPNKIIKRLYSIQELVKYIGGTEWYWRCQIWDKQLPYIQNKTKMMIDIQDIEKFIQNNKKQY